MGIKVVATNRKATHDYRIIEKYESGIVLSGTEVKSIRNNKVSIKEAYVRIFNNELFVIGMNISDYENAGYVTHTPNSDRKLLMHKKEILKIRKLVDEKGKTLVPLRLYFKKKQKENHNLWQFSEIQSFEKSCSLRLPDTRAGIFYYYCPSALCALVFYVCGIFEFSGPCNASSASNTIFS